MQKTILIIDDDENDIKLIKSYLSSNNSGFDIKFIEAKNYRSGFHYYLNSDPDCTILDYRLDQDNDGLQLLSEFKQMGKLTTPIIFITSYGCEDVLRRCLSSGAFMYFDKSDIPTKTFCKAVDVSMYHPTAKTADNMQ